MPLDSDVVRVVRLGFGRRLNFDQMMTGTSAALEHVCPNENVTMLKGGFKNRRGLGLGDEITSRLDCLFQFSWASHHRHSTRKCFLCLKADLISLCHHSLAGILHLGRKFGFMHLEVDPLQALDSGDKF